MQAEISHSYLLLEEYLHELSFRIIDYRYSIFSDSKFIPEYTIQSLLKKINITRRNNAYYKTESCKEMISGLVELENSLSTIHGYLNTTINNFKYFNIHEDIVGADECELSIIIPRDQVEIKSKTI